MKNKQSLLFACIAVLILALQGCVTPRQPQVMLRLSHSVPAQTRIGVVATAIPKASGTYPGARCLLCLGVAQAANGSLVRHIQGLPVEGLPDIKGEIAELLRKRGAIVTVIDQPVDLSKLAKTTERMPPFASVDFTGFKKKYDIDKLVVIEISQIGLEREYHAYVPQAPPRTAFSGKGFLINLIHNTYEWYEAFRLHKAAEGNWDEPPDFPGMTNAFYQLLDEAHKGYLASFHDTHADDN